MLDIVMLALGLGFFAAHGSGCFHGCRIAHRVGVGLAAANLGATAIARIGVDVVAVT